MGGVNAEFNLWTMPLTDPVPPEVIDDFLALRLREHQHLEYRKVLNTKGRNRFVETVAAMANAGGTGLILIGVDEDGREDRPISAWHLESPLRPQSLEAQCRVLQPYVPIEVGSSARVAGGAVTIVRIPDFPYRPVFVPERGILVRSGQANGPASMDQLRAWFGSREPISPVTVTDQGFTGYFMSAGTSGRSHSFGLTRGRDWGRFNWDERTDDALEATARRGYRELPIVSLGQDLIQFAESGGERSYENFLRCDSRGAVLRHWQDAPGLVAQPSAKPESPPAVNAEELAAELIRFWRFAREAVTTVAVDYVGPLTLWSKVGGHAGGLSFPRRPRGIERNPLGSADYWVKIQPELSAEASEAEIATSVLAPLARSFGYRRPAGAIEEAVQAALARVDT